MAASAAIVSAAFLALTNNLMGNKASGTEVLDAEGQVALVSATGAPLLIRNPSSTVVWLMVAQLQFLATLSLVDSVALKNTWLSDFLEFVR